MADAASVLGTPVATVDTPGTAMIPLSDPGSSVNVTTPPPTDVQTVGTPGTAMVAQPTQWTPPQPGQVDTAQSPQPDAEIAAGAVHQNWLARILDSVGTILGGDKTIVATKHPDGSVSVEHNPSTTGEKWGRIAQAALGGAARGMAVGQGPGGAGKAFAAGGLAGLQAPQQALDAANKEAASMNAQQLATANIALTHQKLVGQMLDDRAAGLTLGSTEASLLQQTADAIAKGPNTKDLGTFTDMPGIMKALNSNPDAMAGLTNQALKVIPTADDKGNVQLHAYLVDRGADNRKNDQIERALYTDVDPKTGEPTLKSRDINPQSQPLVQIRQAQQTAIAQYFDMHNKWRTAESTANKKEAPPAPKSAEEAQGMAAVETDPVVKQKLLDAVPGLQRLAIQQKEAGRAPAAGGLLGGSGAAAAGGTTGDDYLKAAVDPSMWNQVRSIANGDVKMPTAGNRGANQALRNAVLNFDPTYTDARYQTKLDFKTKGDSDSIKQLSTVLAHADNALGISQKLGNSPSLVVGRDLSGDAATYNTAVNFFTGEAGKLAMGGIVGKDEADKISSHLTSPIQSIRDSALKEVLDLTGGKVGAIVQKYRAGAGQELPAHEFFDQPTQNLLKRFNIINPAAGPTPTPTPTPTANAAPPINLVPPGHDTTFANGQVWRNVNGAAQRIK
jgi:hypothetical protein